MRKSASLFAACLLAFIPLLSLSDISSAGAENIAGALLITELQTGGCSNGSVTGCSEDAKMEFIKLSNPQNAALNIQGWKMQYLSASGKTVSVLTTLSGTLQPGD